MTHVALTDRDGLYGAVRFAKACADVGVTPVYGADLALAPDLDRPGWDINRAGEEAAARRERGASEEVAASAASGESSERSERETSMTHVPSAPAPVPSGWRTTRRG